MTELLAGCAERFDLVVIDTPPLRPVTDAAVVAANADGAILVFWHGHTKRNQLQAAVQALEAVNARVLGCVLNMKPLSRAERRGYSAYYGTTAARGRGPSWLPTAARRPTTDPAAPSTPASDPAARAAALTTVRPVQPSTPVGTNGASAPLVLEPPDAEALAKANAERAARNGRGKGASLRKQP
jgi:hypothetical protein